MTGIGARDLDCDYGAERAAGLRLELKEKDRSVESTQKDKATEEAKIRGYLPSTPSHPQTSVNVNVTVTGSATVAVTVTVHIGHGHGHVSRLRSKSLLWGHMVRVSVSITGSK